MTQAQKSCNTAIEVIKAQLYFYEVDSFELDIENDDALVTALKTTLAHLIAISE